MDFIAKYPYVRDRKAYAQWSRAWRQIEKEESRARLLLGSKRSAEKSRTTKEDKNKKRRIRRKQRYAADPNFVLEHKIRRAQDRAFRGRSKPIPTLQLLGCSVDEFRKHLESRFSDGMSWNNYGLRGWHIDHIVPISIIDLTDPCEVARVCHYTNMQPLWAKDNIAKRNKPIPKP